MNALPCLVPLRVKAGHREAGNTAQLALTQTRALARSKSPPGGGVTHVRTVHCIANAAENRGMLQREAAPAKPSPPILRFHKRTRGNWSK
eukprot:3581436-Rhodomonas_salina.2